MVLHQLSGNMEITFYIRFLCIPNHNFCWMNHFNPILNKYNTVKKKLKAKVTERKEQLKGTFGKYYDYHRRDIAANEVDYLNVEDPDVFSHRAWELEYQRKQEMQRNQPARTKKKSYDIEL